MKATMGGVIAIESMSMTIGFSGERKRPSGWSEMVNSPPDYGPGGRRPPGGAKIAWIPRKGRRGKK